MAMIIDTPDPGPSRHPDMDYYLDPELGSNQPVDHEEFPDIIFVPSWWMEYGMAAEPRSWARRSSSGRTTRLANITTLTGSKTREFPEYESTRDAFAALTLHRYR